MDAADFFSGGYYLARPPRRVVPADRGAKNAYINAVNSSHLVPSRVAAGTFLALPQRGLASGTFSLYNATNGNLIATTAAPSGGYLWDTLVYDFSAGFYYVLGIVGGNLQLYKINDTTGAQSAVGATTAPATLANWAYNTGSGHAYISSGALKFVSVPALTPFVHTVSLTTGAIVTQDQPLVLSDGTTVSQFASQLNYITADESAVIGLPPAAATSALRQLSFAKSGVNAGFSINNAMLFPNDGVAAGFRMLWNGECLVAVAPLNENTSRGWRYVDRTDYDRYVKALVKATAGV